MLKSLENTPPFFYLAVGAIGATATYLLYPSVKPSRLTRKSSLYGHPRGLLNNGNECSMNVILQSIAASSKTFDWLRMNADLSGSTSMKMFNTLLKLTCLINRYSLEDVGIVEDDDEFKLESEQNEFGAARILKQALSAHNWKIRMEEHDCHELFHLIMSVLEDELNEKIKSTKSLNFLGAMRNLEATTTAVPVPPLALAHNPFHGYLAIQLQCLDCNYKCPLKFESFYSLSLTLPRHNSAQFFQLNNFQPNNLTLYDCLRSFFNFEHLADMKCEKCNKEGKDKQKRGFIKRQAIAKLPECLCIHIQRNSWSEFENQMIKKSQFIQFPLNIKVDEYSMATLTSTAAQGAPMFSFKQVGIGNLIGKRTRMASSSMAGTDNLSTSLPSMTGSLYQPSHTYELSSAIVHFGNALSGHFVIYRKSLETAVKESWLQCSDHEIKEINLSTLLNNNVYMLFYDKKLN